MSGMVLLVCLISLVAVLASMNWRWGFLACIPVGFLQDMARKLTAGEPVWMVVSITLAMAIVFLFYFAAAKKRPVPILMEPTPIRSLLVIFLLLVVMQTFHTLVAYGAVMLAALGILFYFSPLPALALASDYVRHAVDLRRFLMLYVAFTVIVALSVVMAWAGIEAKIFVEVGEGLRIFDPTVNKYIIAYSGMMRTPEVAAWHLGTGACLSLVIAVGLRSGKGLFGWSLVALFLVTAGLLTGRRKMLMEVVVFLAIFTFLALMFRSRSAWKSMLLGLLLAVGLISVVPRFGDSTLLLLDPSGRSSQSIDPYVARGMTGFGDAGERMSQLGFGSVLWAYRSAGFFGAGAGTAAQGAAHFGGQKIVGVGEGGLGRVTGELGIPGLVLVLLTGWLTFVLVFKRLRSAFAMHQPGTIAAATLVSFIGANVPIFMAASQVYADPFVLFVLASCAGFVLRILAPQSRKRPGLTAPIPSARAMPTRVE